MMLSASLRPRTLRQGVSLIDTVVGKATASFETTSNSLAITTQFIHGPNSGRRCRQNPQHGPLMLSSSSSSCYFSTLVMATRPCGMAMKPGTPIPGLDVFKDKDPIVALERSQYPDWVNTLAKPLKSLSQLQKIEKDLLVKHNDDTEKVYEEMDDEDMSRYAKLVNRKKIKDMNNARRKG